MAHALSVRAALASADYQAFFRLYASAPALGRALMDIYVPTLRFDALTVVVKAFKPSVPVPFLASMLGFVAPAARARHAGQATPAAPAALASAGGSPAAGGGGASPAAAAGGEDAGKSSGTQAAGESGAAAAAGPASEAGATPSDTSAAAAAAAGAAALAEPDGSAAAPAAAAGGGAASADGSGSGLQEPPPGCMELYFVGDYAGQVSKDFVVGLPGVPGQAHVTGLLLTQHRCQAATPSALPLMSHKLTELVTPPPLSATFLACSWTKPRAGQTVLPGSPSAAPC